MTKKLALEEDFLAPACEEYWATTVGDLDRSIYDQVVGRLKDFGGQRLEAMDRAGVARAVLTVPGPLCRLRPFADAGSARGRRELERRSSHDYIVGVDNPAPELRLR